MQTCINTYTRTHTSTHVILIMNSIVELNDFLVKAKVWDKTVSINGVARSAGTWKRTYEVLAERNGYNSYALDKVAH